MKEYERRFFLDGDKYDTLKSILVPQNVFPERQVTTYYDIPGKDLRFMQTKSYCKMWLKGGNIHDVCRTEFEEIFELSHAPGLEEILKAAFPIKTQWYRERYKFTYDNISICLDKTLHYGSILELEVLISDDQDKSLAENIIRNYMTVYNLQEKAPSFWTELYHSYVMNWRSYNYPDIQSWIQEAKV